jgi:pyruvate dehydrogenase E2 component (dihydrolipoamide acetyltransferase)
MNDRYEKLDSAERWFFDVLSMGEPPGFLVMEEVDMTAAQELIAQARNQDIKVTYTHVVVRAVALALTRHPELNRLILGKQLVYPSTIDIGISVSSELSIATQPSMVLQDAGRKSLLQLAQEISERASKVRAGQYQRLNKLRKVTRLIPSSWLRRRILRKMKSQLSVVRQRTGTFHVTSIPHLHAGIPFKYPTPAVLTFPRIEDRAVVRDGQVVVRPVSTFCMAGDHRLWQANSAAVLLKEIKEILENSELAAEISQVEALALVH